MLLNSPVPVTNSWPLRHNIHFYHDFLPAQAFLCIALLLGDGLYNFVKVMVVTVKNIRERSQRKSLNKGKESNEKNLLT